MIAQVTSFYGMLCQTLINRLNKTFAAEVGNFDFFYFEF